MNQNDPIVFLKTKDFKFIKEIGQGGTGRTILMKDEAIDEIFVCKKYSPYNEDDKGLYYDYFKDEIKILYKTNHANIVRVFNYYLYPEETTGFIIMEYIDGKQIDKYLNENPDHLEDIFLQTIEGFKHLEEKEILHRDIRPNNILITESGIVKIIDFGFGKQVDANTVNKSITLNWRFSIPKDFEEEIYNHKTDIYFIGKLFEEIISQIGNVNFKYSHILKKMIAINYNKRINSFFDIYRDMLNDQSIDIQFTIGEKNIYQNFANDFIKIFTTIEDNLTYETSLDKIIRNLEELNKNSMLENIIQDNAKLTRIFLIGKYSYFKTKEIKVTYVSAFLDLLKKSTEDKRKIILNNLWIRFDSIQRFKDDDLPF
ncbi:protein kinase family protein [Flavobacterium sp. 5]|uniref:protein kinase family protein n=1 Tax=Flavobacterium sp. 5 TaxID=2035199 RepID=UPI000C2C2BEA|nr:protein kinase family protein [Flavobacterium sp. 5]PKB17759.1 serine/threonine-protein kinase [Flavobacterium sp. 5]